jgi:hypothetical protein
MGHRTVALAALAVIALSAAMYSLLTYLTKGDFEAVGTFAATGTRAGDFSIERPTCLSGERWSYDGVRLSVEGGGGVRITPTEVRIDVPSSCRAGEGRCDTIAVDPKRCSTYDVVVERTNNTYNRRRVWRGHLRLRCRLEPGELVAALAFEKCV